MMKGRGARERMRAASIRLGVFADAGSSKASNDQAFLKRARKLSIGFSAPKRCMITYCWMIDRILFHAPVDQQARRERRHDEE